MSAARFLVGDVFEQLATLEPDSVDLVFTSPPFLALRSYLPADHPDKAKEIGSESTPADFIDRLLDVVEACDRVLAPHGSLVFELGDTYSGSGGAGGDYAEVGLRSGQNAFDGSASRRRDVKHHRGGDDAAIARRAAGKRDSMEPHDGWPPSKSLTGIPTLFAWSLAYGRNLLRPERETPRWRVRNLIPWCRPNPPVGALGDKFRPATSYLTVACKSRSRWFDLDAVRSAPSPDLEKWGGNGGPPGKPNEKGSTTPTPGNPNGAPPLDFLLIPTAPYKGAHYATFPPALVKPFVESMCPRQACRVCGEPRRRIAETTNAVGRAMGRASWRDEPEWAAQHHTGDITETASQHAPDRAERVTYGWTDCGCSKTHCPLCLKPKSECGEADHYFCPFDAIWRPGVVLDPFAGSGTTLAVATGLGRDAIGIDLDSRNLELARERIGMFLVEEATA